MRAVVLREAGGPDKLELCDVERPRPGAGQALVRVRAVGVCHRDILDREASYSFMKRPIVTGHEFAGEVAELGSPLATDEKSRWRTGDRVLGMHRPACGRCVQCLAGEEPRCLQSPFVFGLTVDGSYAEYLVAHDSALVAIPGGVSFRQAAFLECTAAVALRALRHNGRLVSGETVLITGASGGVGIHAIQVAKNLGARVIAVTSSPAKEEALYAAGADDVLVSRGEFHREALRRTDGGVQVALDLVGAPTFNSALRSLCPGGRMVVVGNVTAARVEVNPGWLISHEATITGSASSTPRDVAEVLGWVETGRLKPIIAAELPLAEARKAQERLANKEVVGRIVLLP